MCADSNKIDHIETLLQNNKPDFLLTDPPYGIQIQSPDGSIRRNSRKYSIFPNDDKPYNPQLLLEIIESYNMKAVLWGANHYSSRLPDKHVWLCWAKKSINKGNKDNFSAIELAWTNFEGKASQIYHYLWDGWGRQGNRKDELTKRIHPTQKPVGLLTQIIQENTTPDDIILDLYGGSGSTLIASEKLGHPCYMMELSPYYTQVIINRWEEYTGQKAEKI